MQSDDEWDDDWDDGDESDDDWYDGDESDSNIPTGLVTNTRIAIGVSLVILILLCSMIFTNFGLYSGAGSLSVLIDVNEGRDITDMNFDFNILATSPAFGMLAKEGTYKISVLPISINHTGGALTVTSGKFTLNEEGRGSVKMPYSDVFTVNGDYIVQVECGSQKATDSVSLQRYAETITADFPLFDGEKPLDKDQGIIVNLQFLSEAIGTDSKGNLITTTVVPWSTGKITLYHSEEVFDSGKGEDYWDNDGSREPVAVEVIDFVNSEGEVLFTYDSGSIDSQWGWQDSLLPFIIDTSEFYDKEGSGDYAIVIEFTNDLGSDTSLKTGQSFWKWFHVCQPDSNDNTKCDGNK